MDTDLKSKVMARVWETGPILAGGVELGGRDALAQRAVEICHECGEEEATVAFMADTVRGFLRSTATGTDPD